MLYGGRSKRQLRLCLVLLTAKQICTRITSPRHCKTRRVFTSLVPPHPNTHVTLHISSDFTWYCFCHQVFLHLHRFSHRILIAGRRFLLLQAWGNTKTWGLHDSWGSGKKKFSSSYFALLYPVQVVAVPWTWPRWPTRRLLSHLTLHLYLAK